MIQIVKTSGPLMFSEVMELKHWLKMGQVNEMIQIKEMINKVEKRVSSYDINVELSLIFKQQVCALFNIKLF